MEKKSQKPIRVRIAEKLIKDQQELDHLAVQVSLGKAEMNDEFKKAKADLKKNIHEVNASLICHRIIGRNCSFAMRKSMTIEDLILIIIIPFVRAQ